ncbi:carbon-nitrogen hydrolase family protein [Agromyces mediolanus]|uniref:carbon-nitrogen hydrolase family protein n=1 Tax=Agromyces mediolanus TaxID=41986 RepID=UPI003838487E
MTRSLVVALAQVAAEPRFEVDAFAEHLRTLARRTPTAEFWAFPELHLDAADTAEGIEASARPLDDPHLAALGALAQELGIWLAPGTIYERGERGAVHNTALVFAPTGERVASYRKIFPWRPAESAAPGDRFEVFELPGLGRIGLSICYDIWFPEHARHLAWLGADVILNLVQTATSDREQELAIIRGNAVMNQLWIASVNAAAPTGRGRSLVVDPSGSVRAASPDASAEVLTVVVDFGLTELTRDRGTAGVSRPWSQFHEGDAPIALPLYDGRIEPSDWHPRSKENR